MLLRHSTAQPFPQTGVLSLRRQRRSQTPRVCEPEVTSVRAQTSELPFKWPRKIFTKPQRDVQQDKAKKKCLFAGLVFSQDVSSMSTHTHTHTRRRTGGNVHIYILFSLAPDHEIKKNAGTCSKDRDKQSSKGGGANQQQAVVQKNAPTFLLGDE